MIHVIRVIKSTWLRCCGCVTLIHYNRTWKWELKVLTSHSLLDCSFLCIQTRLHLPCLSSGKEFKVTLKSSTRTVEWFPQKLKLLHHVAATSLSVWWDKTENDAAALPPSPLPQVATVRSECVCVCVCVSLTWHITALMFGHSWHTNSYLQREVWAAEFIKYKSFSQFWLSAVKGAVCHVFFMFSKKAKVRTFFT